MKRYKGSFSNRRQMVSMGGIVKQARGEVGIDSSSLCDGLHAHRVTEPTVSLLYSGNGVHLWICDSM
jgi:hypothetical protein